VIKGWDWGNIEIGTKISSAEDSLHKNDFEILNDDRFLNAVPIGGRYLT
jgi:hypothetical protein